MNKSALRDAILQRLKSDLEQQTAAALLARDEAISEESRPENKYDTHSQEAAYLAEGQARMAKDISDSIAQYSALSLPSLAPEAPIALGAVVFADSGKSKVCYFVGPRAGGLEVTVQGREVLVITPQSPLGRQFMGKHAGDVVALPGRSSPIRITAVE